MEAIFSAFFVIVMPGGIVTMIAFALLIAPLRLSFDSLVDGHGATLAGVYGALVAVTFFIDHRGGVTVRIGRVVERLILGRDRPR